MKKSRRNILLSSLALASSTAFLGACKGGTPDKPSKSASLNKKLIKWKMATSFPKNFPGADLFAQKIINLSSKKSHLEFKRNNNYICSIDRIDSKLGYIESNIHLVGWIVNQAKNYNIYSVLIKN